MVWGNFLAIFLLLKIMVSQDDFELVIEKCRILLKMNRYVIQIPF